MNSSYKDIVILGFVYYDDFNLKSFKILGSIQIITNDKCYILSLFIASCLYKQSCYSVLVVEYWIVLIVKHKCLLCGPTKFAYE